tara:strand:+ start:336 stop:590 length:255 start_codon:yes stop_codon:yes gene_type:complete
MAKAKKITKNELSNLVEPHKKINSLITEIGSLETRKHSLLHEIGMLNESLEAQKVKLEKKYGSVNINLETGEVSKIETLADKAK